MRTSVLTDSEVDKEIERLTNSPYVALARQEQRIRYRRRQYLYTLRQLEKRGKQLYESGVNERVLDSLDDIEDIENN